MKIHPVAAAALFPLTLGLLFSAPPRAAADDLPDLDRLLESRDVNERRLAVKSLGNKKATKANIDALIEKLADDDVKVRMAAADGLAKMGPAAISAKDALMQRLDDTAFTEDGRTVWYAAAVALGRMGSELLPEAETLLDDDFPRKRMIGAIILHEIGPASKRVLPKVLDRLLSEDDSVRVAMIYVLMGLGPEAKPAVSKLQTLMAHSDFHTRYWTCRAIGRLGYDAAKPAVPTLMQLLDDPIASVRGNAVLAIGQLGPNMAEVAVEKLTKALEDPAYNVRESAAMALGNLGKSASGAVPALEASLAKSNYAARSEVAVALWRITNRAEPTIDVLLEELQDPTRPWDAVRGFHTMGKAGAGGVARLTSMSQSENAETRALVADALGGIGPGATSAIARLKELLSDPEQEVREEAAEAIEAIEAKEK